MVYLVKKCKEVDDTFIEKVVLLKRTIKLKRNLIKKPIRVQLDNTMKYLFLQSDILPVLYGVSEYCNFKFIDFPGTSDGLVKPIQKIQDALIEKYSDYFNTLIFSNNIGRNSIRFRYTDETKTFLDDKIYKKKIKSGQLVKIIVCPREIWFTNEKFGFNWDIIQILIVEEADISVTENLFNSDSDADGIDYSQYEKFVKMLKAGVPEGAVKLKMSLEGLDTNIDLRKIGKKQVPVNKNIDRPGIPGGGGGGIGALLSEIKNKDKLQLKKVSLNKNDKGTKNPKNGVKISLSEILNIRKRLTKTGSRITVL